MNRIVENKKLKGEITAITSKSYAHRAIFCAALCKGESIIEIDNISKDIDSSLNAIISMGVEVRRLKNKFYIRPPKEFTSPITINVGESGTTLRLLMPIIASLGLVAKIIRTGSLINRTNSVYFEEFPKHGVNIYEKDECIFLSGKLQNYNFVLPGNISSQFISGFLIASGFFNENFNIHVSTQIESKPYIDMTIDVMEKFGALVVEKYNSYIAKNTFVSTNYVVEKDWSNALFFLASGVNVKGLDRNSKQGDIKALEFFKTLGYENISKSGFHLVKKNPAQLTRVLDAKNMPDAVPILCVMAGLSKTKTEVINIERLRLKESDRVKSTVEMLENLGIKVELGEKSFSFVGIDKFNKATINSYNDHRIAMAASIAASYSDGALTIIDSESVEKSYLNFFDDFKSLGGETHVL